MLMHALFSCSSAYIFSHSRRDRDHFSQSFSRFSQMASRRHSDAPQFPSLSFFHPDIFQNISPRSYILRDGYIVSSCCFSDIPGSFHFEAVPRIPGSFHNTRGIPLSRSPAAAAPPAVPQSYIISDPASRMSGYPSAHHPSERIPAFHAARFLSDADLPRYGDPYIAPVL